MGKATCGTQVALRKLKDLRPFSEHVWQEVFNQRNFYDFCIIFFLFYILSLTVDMFLWWTLQTKSQSSHNSTHCCIRTSKGLYIRELINVWPNPETPTQTNTVRGQLCWSSGSNCTTCYSSKPLPRLPSLPFSASTGNEQTEIITEQTIAVLSAHINLLALPSHQQAQTTGICGHGRQ